MVKMETGRWGVGWDGRVEEEEAAGAAMGLETEEERRAASRAGSRGLRRLGLEETPAVGSLAKYLSLLDGLVTLDELVDETAEELEADRRCVDAARRGTAKDEAEPSLAVSASVSADALSAVDDAAHENPALSLVRRFYPNLRPLILHRLRRPDLHLFASSISMTRQA